MQKVRSSTLSADDWRALCTKHLPGYDAWATAGDGHAFNAVAANNAINFVQGGLQFIEGEKAGQPFVLEPWQQALIAAMFGWKKADGTRRYREAFIYVPRKNGKTPMVAAIVLLMMFTDHEPGAQLYSAAADREQAALIYRHAEGMIARQPVLAGKAKIYKSFKSIEYAEEGTIYKALSSESNTKHGLGAHLIVVDELHAHPNSDLVDVLLTSTAARRQPLIIYITTADFDRESVCNEKHKYACSVRDGVIKDSSFLPVIYEATADDDWTSPATWAKVNPNLNVSVKLDYLERECNKAKESPAYENTFKRLHLNMKTEQDVRWISLETWDRCGKAFDPAELDGVMCFAGIDLASTTDVAAMALLFPVDDEFYVLPHFWIPQDTARKKEQRDRVPYLTWADQGLVTLTPGNVIDYQYIRRAINEAKVRYDIREVAYDPWNAEQFAGQLQNEDGMNVIAFRQGYQSMNEPMKALERLIVSGKFRHGGNPVLRWMASNTAAKTDPAGNIKPDKEKSTQKIDGIVATIMALGRCLVSDVGESVYESRGFLMLDADQ